MTVNSKKILEFLKGNADSEFTTKQISSALDIKCVIGSLRSFVKRGYVEEGSTYDEKTEKDLKSYKITAEGINFDPDAE